ncbi:MAG: tyrosine/phenylalanine carboxypeptidase domain-containing protein, partial [Rhodospirillaceae bacterium]
MPDLTPDRLSGEAVARLTQAASLLRKAERPVRVLRAVAWGPEIAEQFFAGGEKELPQVTYPRMSAAPVHEILAAARALIDGDGPVQAWLRRIADVIAVSADMLQALGTKEF